MKKVITVFMTMTTVATLGACSHKDSETVKVTDTVKVATNQSSTIGSQTSSEKSSISSSSSSTAAEGEVTKEKNTIAKTAIQKIEAKKGVILDQKYVIVVQDEEEDTIDLQIRKNEKEDVTSIFGTFHYTKSTDELKELDETTGEYQIVE